MDPKKDWLHYISMHDYVKVGDEAYFFALNFNGLYRMKLPGGKLDLVGYARGESTYQKHIYGAITENGGKLYLPPRNGREIAVFDLREGDLTKLPLKDEMKGLPFKFSGAISSGTKVFFIPGRYPCLVALDTETGGLEYCDDWIRKLNVPGHYEGLYVARGFFLRDGILYMASIADNVLVKLSVDTMESEMIRIGQGKNGFADMCMDQDGKSIWLVQRQEPAIVKWDEQTGEAISYDVMPTGFTHGDIPFVSVVDSGNKVTAVGYHANMSIELDKRNNILRQAVWDTAGTEGDFNTFKAMHYFAKKIARGTFLVSNIDDNSFDIVGEDGQKERFWLTDQNSEVAVLYHRNKILQETAEAGFPQFLGYIAGRDG